MFYQNKKQKGFTLIELLVVIAIIGILASVILITYNDHTKKARLSNTMQWAKGVQSKIGAYAVGGWSFDNIVGSTVLDDTGNGNHGTIYGGATQVDGIIGKAMNFDGVDDYVSINNSPTLDVADGSFTVSIWFKHTMTTGNVIGILEIGGVSPPYTMATGYLDAGQDKVSFFVNYSSIYNIGSGLNDGKWHNFVAVKNGTVYTFYVDNIIKTGSGPAPAAQLGTNSIGRGNYGYFTGSIDDVRIYSEAYTLAQVQQLYAEGLKTHQNLALLK